MFNHELYASAFGRAVELIAARPPDREQQAASLRAVSALAELSAASLRLYEGVLSVDDVAISGEVPHIATLIRRMQAHRVSELMVGRQSDPAELLALLRGLTAEPGQGSTIKERLRDVASKRIMVILDQSEGPASRRVSVSEAFEMLDAMESRAAPPAAAAAPTTPPPEPPQRPELSEWERLTGEVSSTVREIVLDLGEEQVEAGAAATASSGPAAAAAAPEAAQPAAPAPPPPQQPSLPVSSDTPLGQALSAVVLNPYGAGLLDRLTALSEVLLTALKEDQPEAALRALAVVIDLEPGAPEGSARNSYGIVLRRALTRDVLAQIAPSLLNPAVVDSAAKVMRRGRAEAAEVLLGLLATAESLRERRAYMSVLRTMSEGADRVLAMLRDKRWFVVRNVAELVGDLRVEQAVSELGRLLGHEDQRVARTAAVALAKIGTVATVEPLRRALKAGAPELRAQIAAGIGGPHARALAMPLAALLDTEDSPEVLREYYRALGRIGTPEAVQALARAAEPGGKLLRRKSTALRVAAAEGLRLAGPTGAGALKALAGDSDKAVREIAERGLAGGR